MEESFNELIKRNFFISTANLCSVALGTTLGWTSPAFPKLNPKDGILTDSPLSAIPTAEELSWIGSLVALGALFGKHSFLLSYQSSIDL